MAVRLQMKLGVVPETDRLADSPDTIVVSEPSIGSTARTKGSLYLLATGMGGKRLREATRTVAEKIQSEFYYDESAGIAVCLKKAIRAANKRLLHSGDRYGRHGEPGPIGLAVAVVRGGELYVCTLGPAEAYLVRQARLLTLPDANPDAGLPDENAIEPDVWRGEMVMGDSLFLVSSNVTRRIGLSPIQEGAVTLHPQAAVQQVHRQFVAEGGTGSDAILAIEAAEVSTTHKSRPLKPVWPAEPLAGVPDHSPIPLADTVVEGVAAVQGSAREARSAAGNLAHRAVARLLEFMPRRSPRRVRVTPMSIRRERQRRFAVAVIGLILVTGLLGIGIFLFPETKGGQPIDQIKRGQDAYNKVVSDYNAVFGDGRNLLQTDRSKAGELLKDAYSQIKTARQNGVNEAQLGEYEPKVVDGLNRYFKVTYVNPQLVTSFGTDELADLVLGPDGAVYVVDRTAGTVYRVDVNSKTKQEVARNGQSVTGGKLGSPKMLAVGGPDVVIVDDANALWRWRPIANDKTGRGNLIGLRLADKSTWSPDIRGLGTYVTNADAGLYALYVADPGARQILKYPALADGSGYGNKNNYLTVDQDVSDVDDLIVDGSLYMAEAGQVRRYDGGVPARGWSPGDPGDSMLRPTASKFTRIATATQMNVGDVYAYDSANHRVMRFNKQTGNFVAQYMVPATSTRFSSLTGMAILPGPNGDNPTLLWIESGSILSAALNPEAQAAQASQPPATPSPTPTVSPKPSGKVKATKKP